MDNLGRVPGIPGPNDMPPDFEPYKSEVKEMNLLQAVLIGYLLTK